MSVFSKILSLGWGFMFLFVIGCSSPVNFPLIFGQTHTVGITISGSTTDQGGEFTLGYKDRNFAIVPVTITQADGNATMLDAKVGEATNALSVLGQFEVQADGGQVPSQTRVGLGKFFATGLAADKLADGFSAKLGNKEEEDQ